MGRMSDSNLERTDEQKTVEIEQCENCGEWVELHELVEVDIGYCVCHDCIDVWGNVIPIEEENQ